MLHAPGFAPTGVARLQITREPLVLALPEHNRFTHQPAVERFVAFVNAQRS